MQERGSPGSIMSIRLVISFLVALFVISFAGLILQWGGVLTRVPIFVQQQQQQQQQQQEDDDPLVAVEELQDLYGVVLSVKEERFLHTKGVLASLGMEVAQKLPPSYLSKEVDVGLERYVGSRAYHSPAFLKVWSNRMAFIDALEEFVQDSSGNRSTWRFFFEDDIAMHPDITPEKARLLVAKGVHLAASDGFVYLGLCGPTCSEPARALGSGVEAARCFGTCAHAFGFQRWKAGEFLREMSGLILSGVEGTTTMGFYFDRYMFEYGRQVRKVWVVGSNLKSPVSSVTDHFGLLYQDRVTYPSTIGK